MRLYYLILLFTCSLSIYASAQSSTADQHYTDSMEVAIRAVRQDTAKATLLNQLSDYWSEKDSGKAAGFARQALQLSKGNNFYTASAHFYLAGAYFYFDPVKSKNDYLATIGLLKNDSSARALSLLSRSWHNYGALLQRENDNESFMRILLDHTIPLAQKAGDTLREAGDYASVAMVFSNILNYGKAIDYYQKAIELANSLKPRPDQLVSFYISLAQNYLYDEQFSRAKAYLDSARKLIVATQPSYDHTNYYMVLGMYYARIHQLQPALSYLDTAESIADELNLPYQKTGILFQKYKAYADAKQYSQAKKILLQVYHDSLSVSKPANRLMFLYNLAQTDAAMGKTASAYQWLWQYATLADTLNAKKLKADISGLEIKYQTEKKQREILTLQNVNKQQQLVLQKNRFLNYFLLAGIFILLLISLIVFMLYRNKKRLALQENRLHRQQLKQIEQDHQLKVYNAMLEGQEQERRRMARDLHDGLGGMLAGVKLKLSDIADNHQSKKDMELYKVITQLDNSVQELRRIARNMMPETLIRFGVETALKDLCGSLQTPSLHIEFQAYQLSPELPQAVQITLYRIVQELLTNAVKHANASTILVQCSQNEDRIFITVEDDGQGFDIHSLKQKKGIGLDNIQNRINYLNGKLDIQSQPDEGTIVNVEVNAHE